MPNEKSDVEADKLLNSTYHNLLFTLVFLPFFIPHYLEVS